MGFFDTLMGHRKPDLATEERFLPLLKTIDEVLGREISTARDYEQKIAPALALAMQHFESQIMAIPGPVQMAALTYGKDPFLRAVFPDAGEIQAALGRSVDIKAVLPGLAQDHQDHAFALLGMRSKDRDQAPGPTTVFADHTLACVTNSEAETRAGMRDAACQRLIKSYHAHLEKLRLKGKLLPEEWNIENRPAEDAANAAKRHLIFDDFIHAEQELQPDNVLRGLVAWLEQPFEQFRVADSGLVIAGKQNDGPGSVQYRVPMIHSADRRRWLVFLVEFSTGEGLHALSQESRNHRYIYI